MTSEPAGSRPRWPTWVLNHGRARLAAKLATENGTRHRLAAYPGRDETSPCGVWSGSEADPAVDRLTPLAADPDQPDQVPERTCGESRIRAGAAVLIGCCPSSCGLIDCFVIDACQRVLEACRKRDDIQFAAVPSGDDLAGGIAQDVIE
jgi:hypothetical protein